VSQAVNNVRNDGPGLILPLDGPITVPRDDPVVLSTDRSEEVPPTAQSRVGSASGSGPYSAIPIADNAHPRPGLPRE
jgi:hypothetical protein